MAGKFLLDDEMMENISGGTFKETDEIYEFVKQHDPAGYARLMGDLRGNFSAYFQSIGIEAGYINTRARRHPARRRRQRSTRPRKHST